VLCSYNSRRNADEGAGSSHSLRQERPCFARRPTTDISDTCCAGPLRLSDTSAVESQQEDHDLAHVGQWSRRDADRGRCPGALVLSWAPAQDQEMPVGHQRSGSCRACAGTTRTNRANHGLVHSWTYGAGVTPATTYASTFVELVSLGPSFRGSFGGATAIWVARRLRRRAPGENRANHG
jgi:hypothetical protein